MINNFAQIRDLLHFENQYSFYFLEIIKRRKENPDMLNHAKLIRDYYIYSLEEFDKFEPNIKEHCDLHNARAYFRLNVRNAEKIAFQYNKRLAELLITRDFKNIPKAYAAVAGEFDDDKNKTWIVDLDGDETLKIGQVMYFIDQLEPKTSGSKHVTTIGTKNGIHLITKPFRLDQFKAMFPTIDVHKDNPTILYQP